MSNIPELSIAEWKYSKRWVYSATYDEALADLAKFVIPHHVELGIPGHVEVVCGQIGMLHNCGASSFNGFRHLNAQELRDLIALGWGAGCHSWSHENVKADFDQELRKAKETLEDAIDSPVTVYTSPGDNSNLTPDVQESLKEHGYLAGMSITDDINLADPDDLLWINRIPIHERYWGVFDSSFDPYKRIQQAKQMHGWIVDYMHCPLEQAVHPYKDCTQAHHLERLQTVAEAGELDCWFANPDDVIDYRYMHKHTSLQSDETEFIINVNHLPSQVKKHELTFEIKTHATPETTTILVNNCPVTLLPVKPGLLTFTASVSDGTRISVKPNA